MDTLFSIFSLFFSMLQNFRHFSSFSLILLLVVFSGLIHQIKLLSRTCWWDLNKALTQMILK